MIFKIIFLLIRLISFDLAIVGFNLKIKIQFFIHISIYKRVSLFNQKENQFQIKDHKMNEGLTSQFLKSKFSFCLSRNLYTN